MEISIIKEVEIFFIPLTPSVGVRNKHPLQLIYLITEEYCMQNCYKKYNTDIQNELLCTKVSDILCIQHIKPKPPTHKFI